MKLVSGTPVKTLVDLTQVDLQQLVDGELGARKFSGYVCLTIRGENGFEEGVLLLDGGKILGCGYEYLAFSKQFYGKNAFQRFVNALAAKSGVLDVFESKADDVHGILALNHDALYTASGKDLTKPKEFSPFFEQEVAQEKAGVAVEKKEFFKRFKLKGF
ncbi:DUF2226 domain-containing protein [Candidatus Micrarchaeota archaeon]|nr:DUF2226 domain-containing protein [Candidatus Micrarchaeota archaeon]